VSDDTPPPLEPTHPGPVEREPTESEASAVYRRLRRVFGDPAMRSSDARKRATRIPGDSTPFGVGRDPSGLGDVLESVTHTLGWTSPLARGELITAWPELVGVDIAAHSEPAGIDDGVLTVQCDSTAWATQLRIMRADILTTILRRYPDAQVSSIRFSGPGAPSWKRGPRSVPGRGPRDTYG
jgi:predicted nucleic acid-binding Zn ribbon protein